MKAAYYPILRIVLTLVSGIFMIIYPAGVLSYIAIIIGLLLIIPGLIQLLRYAIVFTKRNRRDRRNSPITFPFIALMLHKHMILNYKIILNKFTLLIY